MSNKTPQEKVDDFTGCWQPTIAARIIRREPTVESTMSMGVLGVVLLILSVAALCINYGGDTLFVVGSVIAGITSIVFMIYFTVKLIQVGREIARDFETGKAPVTKSKMDKCRDCGHMISKTAELGLFLYKCPNCGAVHPGMSEVGLGMHYLWVGVVGVVILVVVLSL